MLLCELCCVVDVKLNYLLSCSRALAETVYVSV